MAKEEKKGFTIIANEVIEMNLPPVEKTILIVLLMWHNYHWIQFSKLYHTNRKMLY